MDLGSTSAISTASASSVSASSYTSKTKTSDFDTEMKSQETKETKKSDEKSKTDDSQKSKENQETTQNDKGNAKSVNDSKDVQDKKNSDAKSEDNMLNNTEKTASFQMLEGMLNFSDYKNDNENLTILNQNIQNLLDTKNLMNTVNSAEIFDYDVINMSESDANFFLNLTATGVQNIASQIENENIQNIHQNIQVSSVLMDKLAESLKTNQPFRINFDNEVSVIIKVNKDGSISANFIPGDKAVEQYLRNNISILKQRFDDENLSYSELSYSRHDGRENQKRKKENDNE